MKSILDDLAEHNVQYRNRICHLASRSGISEAMLTRIKDTAKQDAVALRYGPSTVTTSPGRLFHDCLAAHCSQVSARTRSRHAILDSLPQAVLQDAQPAPEEQEP